MLEAAPVDPLLALVADLHVALASRPDLTERLDGELAVLTDQIARLEDSRSEWVLAHDKAAARANAAESRTPNLEQLVADATEVLTHEIAVKLGIALTPERARDLARNVVQAQAGTLEAA